MVTVGSTPGLNEREAVGAFLEKLRAAVVELQGAEVGDVAAIKFKTKTAVVAGTTSATNIAVAGTVAAEDRIIGVIRLDVAADTGTSATGNKIQDASDLTSEASITSNGNIQLSTTDTSGDKLLVIWYDASATS